MIFNSMPTEDQIRAVAHQIWIDEGKPDGRAEIHWEWALAKFRSAAPTDVSLIDGIGPKIAADLKKEAPAKTPVVQCVYLPKVVRS